MLVHTHVGDKRKFHLCVSVAGAFLLLNSFKGRDYAGSIVVDNAEFPFLRPTATGKSVVNCSMVLRLSKSELRGIEVLGSASRALMQRIFAEAEGSEVLTDEDRNDIIAGLGDWL